MPLAVSLYRSVGAFDQRAIGVVAAPHQLGEMLPLRDELVARGIGFDLAVPLAKAGPLNRWRATQRRASAITRRLQDHRGFVIDPMVTKLQFDGYTALVVSNDWGIPRPAVLAARELGVPSFGIVEGVQDFADVDTGRQRHPYRTVDVVLVQGHYDREALDGADLVVVGSNRLEKLWLSDASEAASQRAVVNCNFSYGVLGDARRGWLRSVSGALKRARLDHVVSKHPADHGFVNPLSVSRSSIDELLVENAVLISRFSTTIFDALALGRQVIYHNPHGERVPLFHQAAPAAAVTSTEAELAEALRTPSMSAQDRRQLAEPFFTSQIDIDPARSPAARAADAICDRAL